MQQVKDMYTPNLERHTACAALLKESKFTNIDNGPPALFPNPCYSQGHSGNHGLVRLTWCFCQTLGS